MKLEEITADDLKVAVAELKAAIAELKADLLKWMIGVQLTFAALILGAVYALLSHWKP